MEIAGKSGTVDPAVRLVRRLSQLKAGFGKKVQQAEHSASMWQECKFSSKLYGQVEKDTEATRASYDNVDLSFDELELAVSETIWKTEYSAQKDQIEEDFRRFIDRIGGVTVDYERACVAERFREAIAAVSVAPAPGEGERGVRGEGGERGGGGSWRAERSLAPDKAVEKTGDKKSLKKLRKLKSRFYRKV